MQTEIRPQYPTSSETGKVFVIEYRVKLAPDQISFNAYLSLEALGAGYQTYQIERASFLTQAEATIWAIGLINTMIARY